MTDEDETVFVDETDNPVSLHRIAESCEGIASHLGTIAKLMRKAHEDGVEVYPSEGVFWRTFEDRS